MLVSVTLHTAPAGMSSMSGADVGLESGKLIGHVERAVFAAVDVEPEVAADLAAVDLPSRS